MHTASGGIPRMLNKIAMLSLIEGADNKAGMIDENVVATAANRL